MRQGVPVSSDSRGGRAQFTRIMTTDIHREEIFLTRSTVAQSATQISAGDLVLVMRDHPCTPRVGHVYSVIRIGFMAPRCRSCGFSWTGRVAVLDAKPIGGGLLVGLPVEWLKKLDAGIDLSRTECAGPPTALQVSEMLATSDVQEQKVE